MISLALTRDFQVGASDGYNYSPYQCIVKGYRDGSCAGNRKLADFNAGSPHPYDESHTKTMWTWDQLDDWWLANNFKLQCWDGKKR